MKTIKAIANYGVLAHEKETVYTFKTPHRHADYSEEIEIYVPEEYKISQNYLEEYLIDVPTGETFILTEILTNKNEKPTIIWQHNNKYYSKNFEWKEI